MFAAQPSDNDLWQRVLCHDAGAFEEIVSRHQAAVSAVSFSCLGDFSASEDISQETFLVAWQAKDTLKNAARLRAWLCGIARNLAKNYLRRSITQRERVENFAQWHPATQTDKPVESRAMELEEQALVWNTLESISEVYREPLVLFYREGQSVGAIADALGITQATAKQRLSRGRNMLRKSVAARIGQILEQSRPGHKFTAAVMASLGAAGTTGKALAGGSSIAAASAEAAKLAASAQGASKLTAAAGVLGSGGAWGLLGGLGGAMLGLAGGWFGSWLPAQLAPTITERELLDQHRRRTMAEAILYTVFVLVSVCLICAPGGWKFGVPLLTIACIVFTANTIVATRKLQRAIRKIRAEADQHPPNDTPLRTAAEKYRLKLQGRVYRSQGTLWGIPWIDIQVSDPPLDATSLPEPKTARGWIAIGDRAHGVLFAFGGYSKGLIAVGGLAVGGIAIGGLGFGLIGIGGLGLGLVGIGGLGAGVLALGGGAIGWQAAGGGALAWQCACGGAAMAYESAFGGAAMAKHYAVGGQAVAEHANDAVAKAFLETQLAKRILDFWSRAQWWVVGAIGLICTLSTAMPSIMYQRRPPQLAGDEGATLVTDLTEERPGKSDSSPAP